MRSVKVTAFGDEAGGAELLGFVAGGFGDVRVLIVAAGIFRG